MERLGRDDGRPPLALPPLGSFLWSFDAIPDLARCDIANRDFLEAIRALAFTRDDRILRPVDYKNLGSEELGSVYESLLELHPELNVDAATFALDTASGHERKTTGSYYTPDSLVQALLDTALDPLLDQVPLGKEVGGPGHQRGHRQGGPHERDGDPQPEAGSPAPRAHGATSL